MVNSLRKTKIEYLDYMFNPAHGCTPISKGCEQCWAKLMAKRLASIGTKGFDPADPFKPTCRPDRLAEPMGKRRKPGRIGVSFMGDLFHDKIPDEFIMKVFGIMRQCKKDTFLLLTKRPERMYRFMTAPPSEEYKKVYAEIESEGYNIERNPHSHIWLGVSVENQATANERIPWLLKTPAAVRWVSAEPLLENISLLPFMGYNDTTDDGAFVPHDKLNLVVLGAESGMKRRDFDDDWARSVRDQCVEAGVKYYFKQNAAMSMPLLDGKVWNELP